MNQGSAEESDPLQDALADLQRLADRANKEAGETVGDEADQLYSNGHLPSQRELRFRMKRDVLLEVLRLCEADQTLADTCRQLAAMPPSRAAFDSKCDLLYGLAHQHPHLRAIFTHYSDLRSALRRFLYTVHPSQTDYSDLPRD